MTARNWSLSSRLAVAALLAIFVMCTIMAPPGGLTALPLGAPFERPSLAHPMGTDDLGRDGLAALAQGGRTSLQVASIATLLALALGTLVGLCAGLGPRWLDEALMRFTDVVASLLTLLIAMLVAALFGGSLIGLALVLGLTRWPVIARIVRVESMSLREREFVRAAIALGGTPSRVALRHVLPQLLPTMLSASGIVFGGAILAEAALAFVGLGDPELTSWGQLIAAGFTFVDRAWWSWAFPCAAIVLASGLVALAADITDATL